MIIGIDFDGTLAVHEYPEIGVEVPGAIETCKRLEADGHQLILYTMRSGDTLNEALDWCKERGLTFWGINKNPTQHRWTESPKVYCQVYIDDAAYGCPIVPNDTGRPYVDWSDVYTNISGR